MSKQTQSVRDFAQRFGISEESVRRALREGSLPGYRLRPGGKWLIPADALDAPSSIVEAITHAGRLLTHGVRLAEAQGRDALASRLLGMRHSLAQEQVELGRESS